jgi:O-antigen ligase
VKDYLTPLLHFQRFFVPGLIALVLWATWRMVVRRDFAVGLALYLGLVIVVDGFYNTGIYIPGFAKGSIRYSEVCAGLLLFRRPAAAPRGGPYGSVMLLVGLYFLLLLFSAFRSNPLVVGIFEFRRLIVPQIIAFAIAKRGMESTEDFRRFCLAVTTLSLIVGLFVFWDLFFDRWLLHSDTLYDGMYSMNRHNNRFGSFFLNPNYLGAFVVLVFPAAFVTTLNEKTKRVKLFAGAGLLALVFCLVETQSRGPLLGFGIGIVLLLLGPAGGISRARRFGVFVPFAALLLLVMPGFYTHAIGRFDEIEQEMTTDQARTRQTVWLYTQRAIADHPLFGIGFGEKQFISAMNDYGFQEDYGEQSLDNPHNSYLQMTVYAGVPALLCFLCANLLLLLRAAGSVLWPSAGQATHIGFALAVGIAGFLTVIYPDMHMFTQTVAPIYWVFFGLLLAAVTGARPAEQAVARV